MNSREALQCLYIGVGKAYTGRDIYEAKAILEKDLDDLEKYEKALETISWTMHPAIVISNNRYYLTIQGGDLIAVLPKDEGEILFELFGGTNYDSE